MFVFFAGLHAALDRAVQVYETSSCGTAEGEGLIIPPNAGAQCRHRRCKDTGSYPMNNRPLLADNAMQAML